MNRGRQHRIKSLYLGVIDIDSPEDRKAFLEEHCAGDERLRSEVLQLLGVENKMGSFLESPVDAPVATIDMLPKNLNSQQIGPYKIREPLGEGGMGMVYVAQQTEPIRRQVALKIIKPGMDSREVVARFEAERQALALMNHPNIAKVFDAGSTVEGRLYFVMELVRGISITEFCDEQRLTIRERLKLFATVCKAVQHAHQKGIIHRDIKPSNVLVELHDVTPVPKVIDFGVAKAISQKLTEQSIYTQFSQMVGTPLYMSPEQAQLSGLDVDTRSDVYSLGVLLYELLTGTTPFDRETLKSVSYDELRRIIREDDPPRPSHRVSTLNANVLSTISERRRSDTRRLRLSLSRELDWIVIKALEKDRTRRYESASALANDIERLLNDQPVAASPPSATYKLGKFARRNRVLVSSAFAIVSVVLVALAVTSWKWNAERTARQDAETQRELAQDSLDSALAAVDQLLVNVAETRLLNEPHMESLRRQLLEDAVSFCASLAEQRSDEPRVIQQTAAAQLRLGKIHELLGDHQKAKEMFALAEQHLNGLKIRGLPDSVVDPLLLEALVGIGRITGRSGLQEFGESENVLRRVLELGRPYAEGPKSRTKLLTQVAEAHLELSSLLGLFGKSVEAQKHFDSAIRIRRDISDREPSNLRLREDLANSLRRATWTSDNSVVIESQSQAQRLLMDCLKSDPNSTRALGQLAETWNELGAAQQRIGQRKDAEESFLRASELFARLADEHRDIPSFINGQAAALLNLGSLILEKYPDRLADAQRYSEQSLRLREQLGERYPNTVLFQSRLILNHRLQAELLLAQGMPDEAARCMVQAQYLAERLLKLNRGEPVRQRVSLAMTLNDLARFRADMGQTEEAIGLCRKGLDILGSSEGGPSDFFIWRQASYSLLANIGLWQMKIGKLDDAEESLLASQKIIADSFAKYPDLIELELAVSKMCMDLGQVYAAKRDTRRAKEQLHRALQIRESLTNRFANTPEHRARTAEIHSRLGTLLGSPGDDTDTAQVHHELAIQTLEKLSQEFPESVQFRGNLAAALGEFTRFHLRRGNLAEAEPLAKRVADTFGAMATRHPKVEGYRTNAAIMHATLGDIQRRQNKNKLAVTNFRRAVEFQPDNPRFHEALAKCLASLSDEASLGEAVTILEELTAKQPGSLDVKHDLANAYIRLANKQSGPYENRIAVNEKGLQLAEQLTKDDPDQLNFQKTYASALVNHGFRLHKTGRKKDAKIALEKARAYYERLVAENPDDLQCQQSYANSLENLGDHLASESEWRKAVELYRQALAIPRRPSDKLRVEKLLEEAMKHNNPGENDSTSNDKSSS